MTGVAADATSTAVLDAARKLRPAIAARSREIEETRALPQDLIDDLVDAGVWRMYVPKAFGGEEMTFPEVFDVLVELARADASVGWVLMIGFMGATFPTQYPEDVARKLYAASPTMKRMSSAEY
jgi:alkylation response protein AidB-like acyl-CoA dehydrogenase